MPHGINVRFEPSGVDYKDCSAAFNNVATDTQICYSSHLCHVMPGGSVWICGEFMCNVAGIMKIAYTRAYISSSYVRKESPILSLSWWGWGSCYESVVLGAPFTPAGITAEAERRVAH